MSNAPIPRDIVSSAGLMPSPTIGLLGLGLHDPIEGKKPRKISAAFGNGVGLRTLLPVGNPFVGPDFLNILTTAHQRGLLAVNQHLSGQGT